MEASETTKKGEDVANHVFPFRSLVIKAERRQVRPLTFADPGKPDSLPFGQGGENSLAYSSYWGDYDIKV